MSHSSVQMFALIILFFILLPAIGQLVRAVVYINAADAAA